MERNLKSKISQKKLLSVRKSLPLILRNSNLSVFNSIDIIVLEIIGLSLVVMIWNNVLVLRNIELIYFPVWLVQNDTSLQLTTSESVLLLGMIPSVLWLGTFIFSVFASKYSKLIIRIVFICLIVMLVFWLIGVLNIKNIALL